VQLLYWVFSNNEYSSQFGNILHPFRKVCASRQWDKGGNNIPENETSYTITYQKVFLMCVENEYCAKHRCLPIMIPNRVLSNNRFPSTTTSTSYQSSFDPIVWSRHDEHYLTPIIVAQTTPQQSNHAACRLSEATLYLKFTGWSYERTAGKFIRIRIITTLAVWKWAVHSAYQISLTGGVNKPEGIHCTPISLMWQAIQCLTFHMVGESRPAVPM